MHSCRAANFRFLLNSTPVSKAMPEFIKALETNRGEDRRGIRLDTILRGGNTGRLGVPRGDPGRRIQHVTLSPEVLSALVGRLNDGNGPYASPASESIQPSGDTILVSSTAIACAQIPISGVMYKVRTRSQGDSNAIFRFPTPPAFPHVQLIPNQIVLVQSCVDLAQSSPQPQSHHRPLRQHTHVDDPSSSHRQYRIHTS